MHVLASACICPPSVVEAGHAGAWQPLVCGAPPLPPSPCHPLALAKVQSFCLPAAAHLPTADSEQGGLAVRCQHSGELVRRGSRGKASPPDASHTTSFQTLCGPQPCAKPGTPTHRPPQLQMRRCGRTPWMPASPRCALLLVAAAADRFATVRSCSKLALHHGCGDHSCELSLGAGPGPAVIHLAAWRCLCLAGRQQVASPPNLPCRTTHA